MRVGPIGGVFRFGSEDAFAGRFVIGRWDEICCVRVGCPYVSGGSGKKSSYDEVDKIDKELEINYSTLEIARDVESTIQLANFVGADNCDLREIRKTHRNELKKREERNTEHFENPISIPIHQNASLYAPPSLPLHPPPSL